MNRFILGDLNNTKFKVGAADCSIYLGTEKLYPAIPQKYKLTLSDASVVTAACDATNAVTQAEISAYTSTLVSAEIGDCITTIGNYAFSGCTSLTSIDIPDSVTSIGYTAFYDCSGLTAITIPTGVTSISIETFAFCRMLTSIDIPNSVTIINRFAFYGCISLTSVTIPSGVTTIDQSAFSGCTSLTSIDIPDSVQTIGREAFNDCSGLTSITVNATTPPTLGRLVFNGSTCPIYVPSASVNAYKSASGWIPYESRIQAIP